MQIGKILFIIHYSLFDIKTKKVNSYFTEASNLSSTFFQLTTFQKAAK
jgi:hypothetical protein